MRPATFLIASLLLAGLLNTPAQVQSWKEIEAPPLRPFSPQLPKRIELPNGMVVFLQQNRELPIIRGRAWIRGGSRDEAAEKVGLAEIFGQAWRTGGTKKRTGDELDDFLEARAAKVESYAGLDTTTLAWDCLKEDLNEVLAVYLELFREPAFREDKIVLAKNQLNTGIARRNDDPQGIAFREAARLVYGANSPYARMAEYATVAAVEREDLVSWHKKYVVPANVILGVTGDFDLQGMEATIRREFGSMPAGERLVRPNEKFSGPKPGIYFVPKEDVTASQVQMVDLGIKRDNPDYFALEVFNQFFGGSFSSRLFSNVRSLKGLAYAVGGGVGSRFDHPGMIHLHMGTRSGTTAAAIDALYAEIDALKSNPPTKEEVELAKASILNSLIFRLDSREKVMIESMTYELFDYPPNFLERYRKGVEKVTAADLSRLGQKYLRKNRLAILVVGNDADFDRPLSAFGEVKKLDVTIPPPPGATAGASN